jgi:hypothetical protein
MQLLLTMFVVGLLTFVTEHWDYRSPVNLIWMIAVPVIIALLANRGAERRGLMSFVLLVCSFGTILALAAIFGLGP